MRRRLRALLRDAGGASAVEFAIVVGPLLLFMLGSVEYGRMYWTRQALYEVAIASARCMGVPQTECSDANVRSASKTQTFAITTARKWKMTLTAANVTPNVSATCGGTSGFSSVQVSYTFRSIAPKFLTRLASDNISVSACFPNSA